jgi:hypothetical protein
MAEDLMFVFLIGFLELLIGLFLLALSAGLYFFDIFKFKLGKKRQYTVILIMFLGWVFFIVGAVQILNNYGAII